MTAYFNLPALDMEGKPAATGAGALYPSPVVPVPVEGREKQELELYNWARASTRSFVIRVCTTFLSATGVLAFLAFLAVVNDPAASSDKKYVTALSVVINMVAVTHYRWIGMIRAYHGPHWLYSRLDGDPSQGSDWTPYVRWDERKAIGVEIMVDAIRYSDWLVTMLFLTYKIYKLINRPFDDYDGVFPNVESAVATAGAMVIAGAFARIGTDEMWDTRTPVTSIVGAIFFGLSVLCLVFLLIDLGTAAGGIANGYLLRSFFYVWIGYPIVAIIPVGVRLGMKCTSERQGSDYNGEYYESLSLIKDVGFGLLDVHSKGVFALWTAYTAFDQTLFNNAGATPIPAADWVR